MNILLSLEQASLLSEFLGLNEMQAEYFLALVQLDRAGNESLKKQLRRQMSRIRKSAQIVAKRFSSMTEVSESDKPLYYSDWIYIAVQQLTAIQSFDSEFKIAARLGLTVKKVRDVLLFLVSAGLCIEKHGKFALGPARIHLSADSPWIKQHHSNWRLHAIENLKIEDPQNLHYSSPMTLSKKDFEKIRSMLLAEIGAVAKIVDPSPSEELASLNMDWFKI